MYWYFPNWIWFVKIWSKEMGGDLIFGGATWFSFSSWTNSELPLQTSVVSMNDSCRNVLKLLTIFKIFFIISDWRKIKDFFFLEFEKINEFIEKIKLNTYFKVLALSYEPPPLYPSYKTNLSYYSSKSYVWADIQINDIDLFFFFRWGASPMTTQNLDIDLY